MEPIILNSEDLEKLFIVDNKESLISLKYSYLDKPILVNNPFVFNEDVASLVGLMPDGSLIRDLMRIYFHQDKDHSKIPLFASLLRRLFRPKGTILYKKTNPPNQVYINSQTLARFFYHVLDVPKSDEPMKVPKWIFNSPVSVKIVYLRSVFDMEGTVLKKLSEIRFVSKDKVFAEGIRDLLLSLEIESTLTCAPRLKQKSPQSRVHIYRKENFVKFKEIGFTVPNNKKRFHLLLQKHIK